jgi:iron complex outermembrane receptor protein
VIDGRFQLGAGDLRVSLSASRQEGEIVSGPFEGATLPQVPDWVTSASVNFRHPFVGRSTVAFNLAYRGQRGGVQEIAGTPLLSDYDVIDARIVFDFGGWQIAAFADNATNEMYVNFASATNKRWSQPRLYGLQFRKAW